MARVGHSDKSCGLKVGWSKSRSPDLQDDEASKAHQVDSMASIYTHSLFTLIATDGADADFGL